MFTYEYVPIDGSKFLGSNFSNHREIIDEYAQRGYRFIGFVPTTLSDYGKIKTIDLVFEKQL